MVDSLAAIVLAAGAGARLAPLSLERPKALCPVGGVPLLDLALAAVARVVGAGPGTVAVNAHHGQGAVAAHVAGRAHVSVEAPEALGTAGAVAKLRPWLHGRGALVVNADVWHDADLAAMAAGWEGQRVRVLVAGEGGDRLGVRPKVIASLLPPWAIAPLPVEPSGLYEVCWRALDELGWLEVVGTEAAFVDCGTPAAYLAANLAASGGETVVGEGAVVDGEAERCVLWPGSVVRPGEVLTDAIRTSGGRTVLIR
ncbi:MAG: sugar phosphate nucleotidyltransferase [Acidimicrobiales bacterium]